MILCPYDWFNQAFDSAVSFMIYFVYVHVKVPLEGFGDKN